MPISQHLIVNSKRSQLLQYVNEREQESVIRVSQKLIIYIYMYSYAVSFLILTQVKLYVSALFKLI